MRLQGCLLATWLVFGLAHELNDWEMNLLMGHRERAAVRKLPWANRLWRHLTDSGYDIGGSDAVCWKTVNGSTEILDSCPNGIASDISTDFPSGDVYTGNSLTVMPNLGRICRLCVVFEHSVVSSRMTRVCHVIMTHRLNTT